MMEELCTVEFFKNVDEHGDEYVARVKSPGLGRRTYSGESFETILEQVTDDLRDEFDLII
ncbi:MAG TPA: hypothetical protein ENN76_02535 [Euryarchaeota archaeon]|nr:hypothetical protein [Euryarchaeota archaeon]